MAYQPVYDLPSCIKLSRKTWIPATFPHSVLNNVASAKQLRSSPGSIMLTTEHALPRGISVDSAADTARALGHLLVSTPNTLFALGYGLAHPSWQHVF